jgi:hypothetical protein
MKKSSIFKWSGLVLLALILSGTGIVIYRSNTSPSRIVLADEAKEHRILLHNAAGEHACDCFSPLIATFSVSKITATSATFTWDCSSPSSFQVNYGKTSAKGTKFPSATPTVAYTDHSVTVTGLEPKTTYHAGPSSICISNCTRNSVSGMRKEWLLSNKSKNDWTFTTLGGTGILDEKGESGAERVAVSDAVAARVTAKDVKITWKTNIPATSLVEYGLTNEYGMKSGVNSEMVKDHDIQLFDLQAGKTYHCRVVSYADLAKTSAKTTAYSSDFTFTTPVSEARIVNKKQIFHEPSPCSDWTMFNYFCYQPVKKVTIDVMTLSGKVVANLESPSSSLAEQWNKVRWNVRDNAGKPLKNGLYVYRMKFQTANNMVEEVKCSNLRVAR